MKKHDVTMTEEEFKKVIASTVKETLTNLGCQTDDPIEMQKDFGHLRKHRESTDAVRKNAWVKGIGFLLLVGLGAVVKFFIGD